MGNNKLRLSIAVATMTACGPLIDGDVQIDGVDPVLHAAGARGDLLSAVSGTPTTTSASCRSAAILSRWLPARSPYIAVPVFPSRAFRHTSIYVRAPGIEKPERPEGSALGYPSISSRPMSGSALSRGGIWHQTIGRDLGARRLRNPPESKRSR